VIAPRRSCALSPARTDAADQAELETLITEWLLTKECPEDYAARCKEHVPR
jgi:hypothetical protein